LTTFFLPIRYVIITLEFDVLNRSIFTKVVKNENSTTELLRNLFQEKPFLDKFLDLFLVKNSISDITFGDISTQMHSPEGRPDIVIDNENCRVLVEIKTKSNTDLTNAQNKGYKGVFNERNSIERYLIFLVPKSYSSCDKIKKTIFPSIEKIDVNTKLVFWEDIIDLIEKERLDEQSPLLAHFNMLLREWYTPVRVDFSPGEIKSMFTKNIPVVFRKLVEIVNSIDKNNTHESSLYSPRDMSEYGIYFKDHKGENILFFGMWMQFWEEHAKPLCFGVGDKFSKDSIEYFDKEFSGKYIIYEDHRLVCFNEDIYECDDPAGAIWAVLEPLLTNIKNK